MPSFISIITTGSEHHHALPVRRSITGLQRTFRCILMPVNTSTAYSNANTPLTRLTLLQTAKLADH
jgi:hypothetical protein